MSVGILTRYSLPFSNVAANNIATANVTPGRLIENVKLCLGGTTFTKAQITQVRVKANGKVIMEGTGTELDLINAFRGETTDPKFLDLSFADYFLNNEFDRKVGGFDTSVGISNITLEVTIAGATAPTLKAIVTESAAQKDKSGEFAPYATLISKVLKYPFNISTGGRLPFQVPFGAQSGSIIKRLHIFHTSKMTGITVKQDAMVIHESVTAENEQEQKRFARKPQANVYTVDFTVQAAIKHALDTRDARSLEWLPEFSGADSGSVIVEYLDPLGNL
ncbi:hypothetical protein SAMN05216428_102445 [Nitrosospira sp. Nsp11]|uniref:major capsid protein P2 n=1 Tax=Nitrosospira sp. Nsp11 TaxID=1855338 RepID=UPI0009154799|nr:major capsid protein P2 [Nitrosospira sp. Nsp11]SHL45136.1 hypothetical protein SAMN05216428_102445 [Nitrosospira sp. Nsp11]